ncbi:MAG: hypothetical protein GVY30_11540 [Chloroflexi bacterium]|jgi:clan AA aspartic protease|nr:hypothetical protein [Chloroflexota bacterium]
MPVVDVTVTTPGQQHASMTITALVDSGADGSLIPITILEQVGARYVDKARMRGVLGHSQMVDIYLATLQIGENWVHRVEGKEAVLGRNVLNHLVITLDGLAEVTEISYHPNG